MKALLLMLAAVQAAAPRDAPRADAGVTLTPAPAAHAADDTKCEGCHTVKSWRDVIFPHERTGFPLEGAHTKTGCRSCHEQGFKVQVPTRCNDCHRDAHAGQLGRACDGCHDAKGWRGAFSPDSHRRTNFPLTGRHAAVSCRECHPVAKDTAFARPTSDCVDCHAADVARAEAMGVSHLRLNFGPACRMCHDTWRFKGARYAAHDACFDLTKGSHVGVGCTTCHSSLPGGGVGACNSGTAVCTTCHTAAKTDAQHSGVGGYRYNDGACVQCHRSSP